ncbi:MAG: glucose-6-phosphate isomerase family protein [Patescibacteria group bacterium]|nr:glucose-6-phosphate isomerase family protein [Patescibacteria group bacterium]
MEKDFNLENIKPDIRYLKDMDAVIYDKDWQQTADPETELYYMYRGLKERQGYRYDITIMFPKMLGKEFNKTKGHTHNKDYGEIYIVLEGEAIYLMQKESNGVIEDAYAIKAQKGDICVIPPYYAHFSINSAQIELKMANWVDKDCKSDYKGIQQKQGACYFYTINGWIKNPNYGNIPPLRFEQPQQSLPKELSFLEK